MLLSHPNQAGAWHLGRRLLKLLSDTLQGQRQGLQDQACVRADTLTDNVYVQTYPSHPDRVYLCSWANILLKFFSTGDEMVSG